MDICAICACVSRHEQKRVPNNFLQSRVRIHFNIMNVCMYIEYVYVHTWVSYRKQERVQNNFLQSQYKNKQRCMEVVNGESTCMHTAAHCNALQRTALRCITLHHTTSHYNDPSKLVCLTEIVHGKSTCMHTVAQRNALQRTAIHCNTLHHTASCCNTKQQICMLFGSCWWSRKYVHAHGGTLQRNATHFIILQQTATHCNTLQHTATHCNTRQQTCMLYGRC